MVAAARGGIAGTVAARAETGALDAGALGENVLGNLAVLDAGLRERFGVSAKVLRGNTASGLVGALRVLLDRVPGGPAVSLAADLLAAGGALGGAGTFLYEEGLGVAFVRRSCCLYYQGARRGAVRGLRAADQVSGRSVRTGAGHRGAVAPLPDGPAAAP
ncbi:hypothetical protein GCM10020254_13330 [Streptomyces goshikiensis]